MLTPVSKFLRCTDPAASEDAVWVLHTQFPRFIAQVLPSPVGQKPGFTILDVYDQPARNQPLPAPSNARLMGVAPRTLSVAEAVWLVEQERPALAAWVAENLVHEQKP